MTKASDNVFPKGIFSEGAAPSTPSASQVKIYAKADGLMYSKDDAGAETLMSGGAGGGGAPTTAQYIVAAADAGLSAEIVIPGLAASPDIRVAAANDDEFDTTDTSDPMTGWTTLGTPGTHDMNSTFKSHYYVTKAAGASAAMTGIYKTPPSIPFTVTTKVTDARLMANNNRCGLFIGEATPGAVANCVYGYGASIGAPGVARGTRTSPTASETNSGGVGTDHQAPMYLRIVVTSSTDVEYLYSLNGFIYRSISAAHNPGFTIGAVGVWVESNHATIVGAAAFDWIRFT